MQKSDALVDQERLYLARVLVEAHGAMAAQYARRNAERLFELDDREGGRCWVRIADAVESVLVAHPSGTLH